MAIERINKIRKHRIFSGFVWPQGLLDFKEKNLFYGWNGTGKSTLSNLFRSIEKQAPISEGQVEFVINGNKIDGANLASAQGLPQVRVFNKDFIVDNVFTGHGAVAPTFFLGEENIEKQKQLDYNSQKHPLLFDQLIQYSPKKNVPPVASPSIICPVGADVRIVQ